MIKRRSNVSLKPVTEIVRTANNQGSPNVKITEASEMIILVYAVINEVSSLLYFLLVCLNNILTIMINIMELKIMTARIGPRNAPQKAPG